MTRAAARSRVSPCRTARCRPSTASRWRSCRASCASSSARTAPARRQSSRRCSACCVRARGEIRFNGEHDLLRLKPHQIHMLGVAWVPEGRQLWNTLTVMDNLRLGGFAVDRQGARRAAHRRDVRALSAPARAPRPGRRLAQRRRAADGCDRARARLGAEAAADGRAFARSRADHGAGGISSWCARSTAWASPS